MKTLYLERSIGECRSGDWVEKLELDGIERIVVGTGPGSFAGIRSAIAFAQGYALGRPEVKVYGLPSPCAIADVWAEASAQLLILGDARQGKLWIAQFAGSQLQGEVFQIQQSELAGFVAGLAGEWSAVSPDDRRIGALLRETLGERYRGEALPTAEGLRSYAEAHPEELKPEPLPLYLNPAVRN